jgi:hypothetical protein
MADFNMDRKAFAVTNIKNYDPTKEPQDGHDYLRSVVIEKREKYNEKVFLASPELISATPKKRVTILDQFSHLLIKTPTNPLPQELTPTPEWEKEYLDKFLALRSQIHESEKEKKLSLKSIDSNKYTEIDVMAMLRSQFEDEVDSYGMIINFDLFIIIIFLFIFLLLLLIDFLFLVFQSP